MYLRIFSSALMVMLAACHAKPAPDPVEKAETIACALDSSQNFTQDCRLERVGDQVIVHRPDGGFRRFTVLQGGGGLAASDGHELATQALAGSVLEVVLGEDRYRIPVAVKGNAKP